MPRSRGYTWKHKDCQLFLPGGTEIRMCYKRQYYYAKVEGDRIIFDGKSLSPADLVNAITSTSRNAWHDLWIKRPDDKAWNLANSLRGAQAMAARGIRSIEDIGL
jgi:hypothetical protein